MGQTRCRMRRSGNIMLLVVDVECGCGELGLVARLRRQTTTRLGVGVVDDCVRVTIPRREIRKNLILLLITNRANEMLLRRRLTQLVTYRCLKSRMYFIYCCVGS